MTDLLADLERAILASSDRWGSHSVTIYHVQVCHWAPKAPGPWWQVHLNGVTAWRKTLPEAVAWAVTMADPTRVWPACVSCGATRKSFVESWCCWRGRAKRASHPPGV